MLVATVRDAGAIDSEYIAAYFRAASIAVGLYEYICTLPAEYKFYRQQWLRRSLSQQCVLFILIRYSSAITIALSNVGFFGVFSAEGCNHFHLVSPISKAIQTLISQVILASRTYSISRRARWVFWTLSVAMVLFVPIEFLSDIVKRQAVQDPVTLNCTSGNSGVKLAWINYAIAMIFDLLVICISTGYLWSYNSTVTRVSHFVQTLLYEGLGYFVALTACNILNLVLYLKGSTSTQSTAASLGYVIIFIMSQNILIRQREYAERYSESLRLTSYASEDNHYGEKNLTLTRRLDSTHEINAALRSQLDTSSSAMSHSNSLSRFPSKQEKHEHPTPTLVMDLSLPGTICSRSPISMRPSGSALESHAEVDEESGGELNVSVRIEQTVSVEHARRRMREDYRIPRTMWDSRGSYNRET